MSDLELRDHSQPCEHGKFAGHHYTAGAGNYLNWCPGGKKITLHRVGWCHHDEGHLDGPTPDEPDDYGSCGFDWTHEAWMSDWVEVADE